MEAFNVVKLLLFVDIDEDTVVERAPETGPFHLARLEHGIAIRENNRRPPLLHIFHCAQGTRI